MTTTNILRDTRPSESVTGEATRRLARENLARVRHQNAEIAAGRGDSYKSTNWQHPWRRT